jgi:hypothetical protein
MVDLEDYNFKSIGFSHHTTLTTTAVLASTHQLTSIYLYIHPYIHPSIHWTGPITIHSVVDEPQLVLVGYFWKLL